jgi:multicomponent Na+:H+ antiporter subunit B
VLVVVFTVGAWQIPGSGSNHHPYRDQSVPAALAKHTANVVSAINYDQRALDTLGEETILLAAVAGAATLLRPGKDEHETQPRAGGRVLGSTVLGGYLFLPVALIIGLLTVVHGAVTPGGGFQGGVALGTGVHLLYVAGTYRTLESMRPLPVFTLAEAVGAGAFVCLGLAGTLTASGFLANFLPTGALGSLKSSGTVPWFSAAVGVEVAAGMIVLVAAFLAQTLRVRRIEQDDTDAEAQESE